MYPRTIKLENDKLKDLITKKGELVTFAIAKSEEIEAIEKEMETVDIQVQEEEKKIDISDLLEKEKGLTSQLDKLVEDMKALKQEIFDRMIKQVPQELHAKYEELKKSKEDKEIERNKLALKAQKYNDKIIPLGRKMMKPLLEDMYEDFDTLALEDGEIVATIFSHLNDFKMNFKKK